MAWKSRKIIVISSNVWHCRHERICGEVGKVASCGLSEQHLLLLVYIISVST